MLPLVTFEILRLSPFEFLAVHFAAPSHPHFEATLSEEPERLFRAEVTGLVGVEEQRHLATREAFCEAFDLGDLFGRVLPAGLPESVGLIC